METPNEIPDEEVDVVVSFDPTEKLENEISNLRATRKSLGGERLQPIEIDMDILVDAYPNEASFLATTWASSDDSPRRLGSSQMPMTPMSGRHAAATPGTTPGRKTPSRRFFKSESEREYAKNLMKELVQIYILKGTHGREAFRMALNETRRRIHLRRGEEPPPPPALNSPIHSPSYPAISPPEKIATPYTKSQSALPAVPQEPVVSDTKSVISSSPIRRLPPLHPSTPSRVKSMVTAIQTSTPSELKISTTPSKNGLIGTPSKVRAVAASIEAQIEAMTPTKPTPGVEKPSEPAVMLLPVESGLKRKMPTPRNSERVVTVEEPAKSVPVLPMLSPVSIQVESTDKKADDSPVRVSSRLRGKETVSAAVHETPISKSVRKNQEIVEKESVSRRGRKQPIIEDTHAAAESPPETATKRTRRAVVIAEKEEVVEAAETKKVAPKKAPASAKKPRQSESGAIAKPATGRKKKAPISIMTSIPEDEPIVVPAPIRPTRKAKASANEIIKK